MIFSDRRGGLAGGGGSSRRANRPRIPWPYRTSPLRNTGILAEVVIGKPFGDPSGVRGEQPGDSAFPERGVAAVAAPRAADELASNDQDAFILLAVVLLPPNDTGVVLAPVLFAVKAWHGLAPVLIEQDAGVPRHFGIGCLPAHGKDGRIAGRCHVLVGGPTLAVAVVDDVAEHLAVLVVHGLRIADDRAAVKPENNGTHHSPACPFRR